MKTKSLLLAVLAVATAGHLNAAYYLNEDFSTYTDGDLVGQNGWTQYLSAATNPIQISSGMVVMSGNSADNQDAQKAFSIVGTPGTTFYYGFEFQALGPGGNGPGFDSSYFAGLLDQAGFVDSRLAFLNIDDSFYQFSARVNGQDSNPYDQPADFLEFGITTQTVVLGFTFGDSGTSTPDSMSLWLNPTSSSEGTPDLTLENMGAAISGGFDALILSQFTFSSDVAIGKLAVADTYGEVFATVVPEPATYALLALGGLLVIFRARRSFCKARSILD